MKPRMHCADCGSTDLADTVLEGSDRVEWAAWLLGGLPGWLYCAWRHAFRTKVCAACGSSALLREARAAAARRPPQAPPSFGTRVVNRAGPSLWPHSLRDPRRRLVQGPVWLAAWLLVCVGLPAGGALLAAGFVAREASRALRFTPARCRAWDASGRPLRIELA